MQRHVSGWETAELEGLGYRVLGIEGLKQLRGEMAAIRWRPHMFWQAASLLSQLAVTGAPRLAFRLLATKNLGGQAPLAMGQR